MEIYRLKYAYNITIIQHKHLNPHYYHTSYYPHKKKMINIFFYEHNTMYVHSICFIICIHIEQKVLKSYSSFLLLLILHIVVGID